ncbi:NAD-dependent glutamate dehydrogenase [Friedmanniomyces endolithicus]|uniref:NAD-specific glutamate dehydrogenase n=1 Tax=Friedmanniomyces endolithicus TaxID=329885 RepID=A0AAN6KUY5_9PEZI|nr:NAD-dependent glutamate dehydrogenase [Friedmanniomyces endolithicus]KAK0284406.1 NAD-dependent glutamate dehydrogenase [Friedmanniomyces endolithicus]KAK0307265.1 NAD-dependent glutamate dehydrogenase [Friedmanniomyces endolithicus]KAK0922232.1 NAD-dependent glutamate dehydrogenase [Friedmanniomyces endolithicus]KAK0996028.1 NAD-dependent glutamate dehydrogenase [Friedmanniomyces endolithicus]
MASGHANGSSDDANGLEPQNKLLERVVRTPGRQPSPQPTHLGVPGAMQHRVLHETGPGYVAPKFEGKAKQMDEVKNQVDEKGFIPTDLVDDEVEWFYNELGIDDMYFSTESADAIVSHVHSLYAAKVAAYARDDKKLEIRLDKEAADHAVYIDTSVPGLSSAEGSGFEARLEQKYLDASRGSASYRVETFRSPSKLLGGGEQALRCYFVYQASFKNKNPAPNETSIDELGDVRFLQKTTPNTRAVYQRVMEAVVSRTGPVIDMYDVEGSREKRLVVAFKQGSAIGLFTALSDLYHYYGLTSSRKYVEQFSNGITILSIYLRPAPHAESRHPPIEASIHQITKEVSLLYCIPQSRFQAHFTNGKLSLQESIYAHCVWVFTQHFLNRLGNEYNTLTSLLDVSNIVHAELLSKLKKRLRTETFTADYILEIINQYPELVRSLYLTFANAHYVQTRGEQDDFLPTLSYLRMKVDRVMTDDELKTLISKTAVNEHHEMVMTAFRVFNSSVLKTNFYTPTKVALSFRLNPSFLPPEEYPQPLFGMFLVISSEFRGFHLRFRDIARGGIRIVKSRSREAYAINARSLFGMRNLDENYNLANTQQRKNKDIPEGGSKGVILLDIQHQDKVSVAFEKYIDSIMDLLLPPTSPGIKDPIVDLHGKEEILFLGPDENTADLVDWATEHARARGAPWWKSFMTGKSPTLGGIPHDKYGMTTLSVREYVLGIYRKLGLEESQVRKLQTGGPDGDLGSNEILLGNEKYCAIVDGAGVLMDPNGLDRTELLRLAKERKMISSYDITKLSKDGYRVLVEESNITLPSGEVVNNGTSFRNTFHLRGNEQFDMFVPCGGRPESIDFSSASRLISKGKAIIPYIVEGANLFITQEAKLRLEKAGCIIFKDASANKGGVTSSSLEVLASLSFDDDNFLSHMCVQADGTVPKFYRDYVTQVQAKIQENARLEFEAIWRENQETGVSRSVLSDRLSLAITKMDEELQGTELWDNVELRRSVLSDALPALLLHDIGLDKIMERVPDNYLRAIFGSYLASRFIYTMGISASPVSFFAFMNKRMAKVNGA